MINLIQGDALEMLKTLPDKSVQTCVTSPPYYGLRSYLQPDDPDKPLEIGLEETPKAYIEKLVAVFREVKRVLRDDGTCWVNIGDSYASAWARDRRNIIGNGSLENGKRDSRPNRLTGNLKEKDLIGIPWMFAFAMRDDGWYLRQDIIWAKPNPMPESVKDRCTKSHEYIFLFARQQHYYYDAISIAEPSVWADIDPRAGYGRLHYSGKREGGEGEGQENFVMITDTRNKRDVWTVNTKSYKEAHFATYPPELITPCILAGSKVGDTVLDPFVGAGTTMLVAQRNDRNGIGIDLNGEYLRLAKKRCYEDAPLFFSPESCGKTDTIQSDYQDGLPNLQDQIGDKE